MKIKAGAKWKSLPLSNSFFSAGGLDQAVCGGIEELTDYTLLLKGNKSGKVRKKGISAPAMKVEEGLKRKMVAGDEASGPKIAKKETQVERKKRQKEGGAKKVKQNTFKVIDVEEETDFLKLSRSQVVEDEKPGKKKKKKNGKKSGKNKPAINLDVFNGLAVKVADSEPAVAVVEKDKEVEEEDKKALAPKNKEALKKKKTKKKSGKKETPVVVDESEKKDNSAEAEKTPVKENSATDVSEWKAFFVCDEILKALEEKGFNSPTPIQRLTLPASLKGKMDIVGAAETGSGKTLAFGIPIIQGILEDREYEKTHPVPSEPAYGAEEAEETPVEEDLNVDAEGLGCVGVEMLDDEEMPEQVAEGPVAGGRYTIDRLRALVLTPTRELALQIEKHLGAVARHTGVGVATVVGGMSVERQLRLLARGPAVVVATPGRLWDLVQEGNPHLANLANLRYLAVDETDRMVERGHFEELQKLLEMINAHRKDANAVPLNSRDRQTFIMSATLSMVHKPPQHAKKQKSKSSKEKMEELMEMVGVRDRRKVVDITRKTGTAETLSESVIHCGLTEKDFYIYYFLKSHPGRTVVFCNSIDCVRRLTNLLGLLDISPLPLHAQLQQKQRLKNLDRFTASPTGLLIATDVAARGLDIPEIQHVVHYQVPRTSEGYVHRSGRTARAAKAGLSLLLVEPAEQRQFRKLGQTLAREGEKETSIPTFPVNGAMLAAVKERITAARALDKMLLANRKAAVEEGWRSKAAKDAELVLSDAEDSEEEFYQGRLTGKAAVGLSSKAEVAGCRAGLLHLLRTPLDQAVYGGAYPTMGGLLPTEVLSRRKETAVECLASNLRATENLLKGKKKQKDKVSRRKKPKKKSAETVTKKPSSEN